ncbi:uncharacterized protein CTRU02_201368 [Colletotrichum truncatum]|uniref:Uncharacterized protein n=1 Tax=Colletotrichum truncatum TaxID=5467 RepID=A0ACC3ZH73_COLTU
MIPTSLGKKPWDGLPKEIRLLILQCLIQDGCTLGPLATVSREWQMEIERYNFGRLRLTPSRLVNFSAMTQRNRALVRYIWFCLELDDYDCTTCAPALGMLTDVEWEEAFEISDTDKCPITTGFRNLFSILSTWNPHGDLSLDISIYSPSDSEHWFKYLTFMPDTVSDTPGEYYQYLFASIQNSNNSVKRLVVFENFNQQYPATMQRFQGGEDLIECDRIRNPDPAVSQMVALASLKLEHLAASFIADASHFFEIRPAWKWPNLTSLVLTSRLLTPDENSNEIGTMLRAAAAAAMKMPRLETMEIWNGRKGLAALFRYQAFCNIQQAVIVWRCTWRLAMEPSTIQAWEAVMHQYDGWKLDLVQERLDEAPIKSHGDALHYLRLLSQAIRPISLQQIQVEQKALEGVDIV